MAPLKPAFCSQGRPLDRLATQQQRSRFQNGGMCLQYLPCSMNAALSGYARRLHASLDSLARYSPLRISHFKFSCLPPSFVLETAGPVSILSHRRRINCSDLGKIRVLRSSTVAANPVATRWLFDIVSICCFAERVPPPS